jgi:LPXTG-site transpeptidase (sortase) family protein
LEKLNMRHTKLQLIVGLLLIVIGSAVLISIIRGQNSNNLVVPYEGQSQVAQAPTTGQPNVVEGQPSELLIPSLKYDLPVIPGVYNPKTKTWTLSLSEVQYATVTPEPNSASGNTFFYGHYRRAVFASLHTIQIGATAIVKTTNGHSFYYQLVSERITNPADTSLFSYKGKPILTIQTCTGLFFQNRQLFTFNLVRVA